MAEVTLNLLNIFSLKIGESELSYEGKKVKDVVKKFVKEHGDKLDEKLLGRWNKLSNDILILLNGENIKEIKGYKTKLRDGDNLYFSVPLSGG
ncbi:MAG: MoaD/ThiS family protein [Promethearchaeia archaeon]